MKKLLTYLFIITIVYINLTLYNNNCNLVIWEDFPLNTKGEIIMKKFSTRKIAALALVFCLFLSVFANTGMFTAKAATEVSASYTYSGSLTDLTFGVNGGYAAGTWSWVNGSDLVGVSGSKSGNTYTVTWDSEVYAGVQLWIYSGTLGKTEYPSLNPGDNKSIYSTADGFTYTDPNTGTTATATVTYVPSLSSSSWFGVTSCEYIGDGSSYLVKYTY